MPKLKTNKSARKRFIVTKKGKIKRFRAGRRHLLSSKSSARKKHLRKGVIIQGKEAKVARKLLPYG